jgi:hypothetical protein
MANHDLASCSLTIGANVVIPGGEGEFAAWTFGQEFETTTGNGVKIRSMSPERKHGQLVLTVFPQDAACAVLGVMFGVQSGQTIRQTAGSFPGQPLSWVDPVTGTTFRAQSAAIMQAASPTIGRVAATVTWTIDLINVSRTYSGAVPTAPVP